MRAAVSEQNTSFTPLVRDCYVLNANPAFQIPAHHKHELPAFNKRLINVVSKRDVSRWEGFYFLPAYHHKTHQRIERQRHFNKHRARAICALAHAMCYHLHIASGTIPACFTTLANEAGLATVSKAGNLSITRATRAAHTLAAWGLIQYKLIWDKVTKQYFPAEIEVTELFFDFIGVGADAFKRAQNQQLAWINRGLLKKGEAAISLTEARRRQKQQYIETTWKRRKASQEMKKIQKAAKVAVAKKDEELRHMVAKQIQSEIRQGLHEGIDLASVKHLLNKRIMYYRTVASSDDPNTA